MATSMTGKITAGEDDTSWVESVDVERMDSAMVDCGVMIMGKNTYESFGDELPIGKALLVVMTQSKELLNKNEEGIVFTNNKPAEVLKMLKGKGFKSVLLAGGEKLNSSFLKENLIDEIRIIIKPILIGHGKSLFNVLDINKKLKLNKSTKLINDTLELTYTVL